MLIAFKYEPKKPQQDVSELPLRARKKKAPKKTIKLTKRQRYEQTKCDCCEQFEQDITAKGIGWDAYVEERRCDIDYATRYLNLLLFYKVNTEKFALSTKTVKITSLISRRLLLSRHPRKRKHNRSGSMAKRNTSIRRLAFVCRFPTRSKVSKCARVTCAGSGLLAQTGGAASAPTCGSQESVAQASILRNNRTKDTETKTPRSSGTERSIRMSCNTTT